MRTAATRSRWALPLAALVLHCADTTPARRAAPAPGATTLPALDGRPTAAVATAFGRVTVDDEGVLRLGDRVLEREVLPELAVAPSGRAIAYPRRSVPGTALVLRALPDGGPRVVSGTLQVVDRPVFHPSGRALYAWGSDAQEALVGLYRLALAPGTAPRRLRNVGIASALDARFVPAPIDPGSQRFLAPDLLAWQGPDGTVATRLAAEELP